MRNKDIKKSGKTSWLATTNGHALSPIFYHFALLEKQAYQKMQREKLYNLHTIAYFFSCIFCFQSGQNFERSDFDSAKMGCFLIQVEFISFYLIVLLPDMFF